MVCGRWYVVDERYLLHAGSMWYMRPYLHIPLPTICNTHALISTTLSAHTYISIYLHSAPNVATIYTRISTFVYLHSTHVRMSIFIQVDFYVCIRACMYIHLCTCKSYAYMYICLFTYVYIQRPLMYIEIEMCVEYTP